MQNTTEVEILAINKTVLLTKVTVDRKVLDSILKKYKLYNRLIY